jgi:hypothetical protein
MDNAANVRTRAVQPPHHRPVDRPVPKLRFICTISFDEGVGDEGLARLARINKNIVL